MFPEVFHRSNELQRLRDNQPMLSIAVISGFLLAIAAPALHRLKPAWSGVLLSLLPLSLFIFFLNHAGRIAGGDTLLEVRTWAPAMEVGFSFYLDGLGLIFALLITGIGTVIVFYSGGYLRGHPELGRFYLYLLGFMASMLGLVLAGNGIVLFIFWELTSLTSYFLIGFDHQRESARSAALQALLVTGLGGLALLAGILMLGAVGGSLEIYDLLDRGASIRGHALYFPILLLVLIGAFTKSAQFPFHFWLPSAMEGPAPVSAFLHSATMVKAGVYLLLRLTPVLGGTETWHTTLTLFGAVTMIGGAWLALFQSDMKKILAYTTVNGLGTMVYLTGLGSHLAIQAAVVFLVGHALYKGSLFLAAGVVDHETGSRDVRRLQGLFRQLPAIAIAAILSGFSMAGLPPLLGFVAKELVYETVLKLPTAGWLPTVVALGANALLFAATAVLLVRPFFSGWRRPPTGHHRISLDLTLGPLLPAAVGLFCGLAPGLIDMSLVSPAVSAVTGRAEMIHLSLWHGLTPMLALSGVTVLAGAGLALGFQRVRDRIEPLRRIRRYGPEAGYDILLAGLKALAAWQTRIFQGGYLHNYVLTIVLTVIGLTGVTLASHPAGFYLDLQRLEIRLFELVITGLMIAGAVVAVVARSRLSAVVAMGVIGYGLALVFIDFGAPDLAMTQFIIETMTVILFVLVIYRLPHYTLFSTPAQRFVHAVVGIASGLMMTFLVLVALSVQQGSLLSDFFFENSLLLAHGRNVVNVIIVDFRSLDTLGEITVLSLAGIGVYTLLKLRPREEENAGRAAPAEEEQTTN
jgi:multicomponent Na+:H+ antiporter subunit A